MQLRDTKVGIDFPSRWSFFGGQMENKERPLNAARRELREELGIKLNNPVFVSRGFFLNLGGRYVYAFAFWAEGMDKKMRLNEGAAMKKISSLELPI